MTAPSDSPPAAPAAPPAQPPAPPAAPAPTPANMPASQPPAPAVDPAGDQPAGKPDTPDEPPELAKVRREAAGYRTRLREQEQAAAAAAKTAEERGAEAATLKDVLAKLNAVLNPDASTPPDPAKLAEQLAAAQDETAKLTAEKDQQIRALTIRAALPGALAKNHADPTLTEAVLTAGGVLAKLDPASDTFTADLESAVAAAVEANPRLKVVPVAKRSGTEIPGRSGGSEQVTREQLAAMKPEQIEEARQAGRLRSLLGG